MITIVDYHLNNLRSLENTLLRLGYETCVTSDAADVRKAEKLILPGVGAFGKAMDNLRALELVQPIREKASEGIPVLGVCLGFHLLFSESEEFGQHAGLDLLRGSVRRFASGVHVPHMGWNQLIRRRGDSILEGVEDGSFVYFVHSYYAVPADPEIIIAGTDYGAEFPSVVGSGNVRGTQFHPEKSQHVGEKILDNFARL
jgi:glutamine amidotransferase